MSSDRTAEIWSTRLQRELLALSESQPLSGENEKANHSEISMLPPFIVMKDYAMDIAKGVCKVNFRVEVVKPKKTKPSKEAKEKEVSKITAEETEKDEAKDEKEAETEKEAEKDAETENEAETEKDAETENEAETEKEAETKEVSEEKDDEQDTASAEEGKDDGPHYVLITLDASMQTNAAGVVEPSPNTYPFQKPRAILAEGANIFPPGSTVTDGDFIEVDCDWTPSLHLSDAALNVSLKIRESIRKGDPFMRPETTEESSLDATLKKWGIDWKTSKKEKPTLSLDETSANRRRQRHSAGEIHIGDIVDLQMEPFNTCAGIYSCKAIRRPEFAERMIAEAEARQTAASKAAAEAFLEEDDEVPSGIGNYMRLQAGGIRKVAGAGIVGAGSIFKSIVQSTKSVLEESYLMITDEHILELRSNKFSIGSAFVTLVLPIAYLAKLKFRRQESISLFFKQSPEDPLIFMCPDSADAVNQIQVVLKRHGVKGKHTNAAIQRSIQAALNIVVSIQAKEKALVNEPTVARVDEIMSLYRQAAEKFESAGDPRHEEVMSHMHKFLNNPTTVSILDGSYKGKLSSVPQGEVLAATYDQLDDEDDDDDDLSKEEAAVNRGNAKSEETHKSKHDSEDASYQNTIRQADDIFEEAKRDMDNFGIDDDLDKFLDANEKSGAVTSTAGAGGDDDPVAELDAMLSAADKELSNIMES